MLVKNVDLRASSPKVLNGRSGAGSGGLHF